MKTLNLLLGAVLASGALIARPAAADLVPGGPNTPEKKLAADCYAELDVPALASMTVTLSDTGVPTITCVDGTECDQDSVQNGKCVISLGTCINQNNLGGCTPPASLDSFKAKAKVKKVTGSITVNVSQLLEGSACGSFVDVTVPLGKNNKPGKGKITLQAKAPKGTSPKADKDKVAVVCEFNDAPPVCDPSTRTLACPANAAGGPAQLSLVVAQTGNDLDNGWTGVSQNFSITPNGSINVCLTECDTSSDTECTSNGAVGSGTLNGPVFGAPLPLLASNVPVCVVNRFNQPITGTVNYGTGNVNLHVTLLSDVYFTNTDEVCPRCGNNNTCTSGENINKPCTTDAHLRVAEGTGNKEYDLSEDCPPLSPPVATLDIDFNPLTSGDTGVLSGGANPPCPRTGGPGINPKPNSCTQGCGAQCTGLACVDMIPNPTNPSEMVCVDNKGGISQMCCNDNTSRSCFPLENGGTLSRVGRADVPGPAFPDTSFPKVGTGTVAAVFCEAATGNSSIDGTTGLPGPSALLISGCQYWLQD